MIKQFSLLQLFSVVDGRLSTKMEDVYEILGHVCDTSLFTHHLPPAMKYLKSKSPAWFVNATSAIDAIKKIAKTDDFETLMAVIKSDYNTQCNVPQLKDECDTSDFTSFMMANSLL
jgi:hypothetical protein